MTNPKPISLTQVAKDEYTGLEEPQEFLVVGAVPGGGGGGGGSTAWADITGKPSTFAPAAHSQAISTITGLPAALDAKVDETDFAAYQDAAASALVGLEGAIQVTNENLDSTHGTAVEALEAAAAAQATANGRATVASVTAAQSAADAAQTTANGRATVASVTEAKSAADAAQASANSKAPLASPAFTGTPTGITKAHVGLPNVDNTSDANKPVSTAQQTALDLKLDKSASAALNTVGWDRAVYIANGGTVPANTPAFTVIRELA